MHTVAILGAGALGETLARKLADGEAARRVILVDPDDSRAQGKALDLMQSGPLEGSDTHLEGRTTLQDLGPLDALVVADWPELSEPHALPLRLADFVRGLLPALGEAPLVLADAAVAGLLEAAVGRGVARDRVMGSAPVAWSAALARHLATALGVEPRAVCAMALGTPPESVAVPVATASGADVEALAPGTLRRALDTLARRRLGPVALATAAARVLEALDGSRASILPVVAWLEGEFGHRDVALGVPARLARGRIAQVVELPLDPKDRVALDNAVLGPRVR